MYKDIIEVSTGDVTWYVSISNFSVLELILTSRTKLV